MKKHIIWSNIDCGELKDWKEYFIEYLEINKITDIDPNDENALQKFITNTNYMYLEDERDNLNKTIDGKILVIADLGLWNGRRTGYKILSNNISDILYDDSDSIEWYADQYNIRAVAHHHDGTNSYEYRIIREDRDITKLLDDIYYQEKISRSKINYYTKSLLPEVTKIYGW